MDGGWVDVSDAEARTRRSGATATLWRDTVIFIGGRNRNADGGEFFTEVLSFSLTSRRWSSLGDAPFAGRAHHTATLVPGTPGTFGDGAEDEIWVVGGTDVRRLYGEAWVYTPATGEWRDETACLTGAATSTGGSRELELLRRAAHGAAALATAPGHILLHAGTSATGGYLDDVALLDTRAKKVSAVAPARGGAPVPLRRGYHTWAALGPFVVLFGGRTGDGDARDQLPPSELFRVYDPANRKWLPRRAAGAEPLPRWNAAAAVLPPAPGSGTAGALLLHGGVGVGAARLGDAHVLRCGAAGHTLTWHALTPPNAPPLPRAYHAAAAAWAPGAPPGAGGLRLLLAGGGTAVEGARHFTLCADAFMLHLPRAPWEEPGAAPPQPQPQPRAAQPSQAAGGAGAVGTNDAAIRREKDNDGGDEASQWRKRPRGNPAATATATVAAGGAGGAGSGRRSALSLAPAADVRAAEAAAAMEERLRGAEREAAELRAALAAANAGWSEQNASLVAARRAADGAAGEVAALRAQLDDARGARVAAEAAAARAKGESRAAELARDQACREAADARAAANTAAIDLQVANSKAAATSVVHADERAAGRAALDELRAALAVAEGGRAAAEGREAALKRAAEDARAELADARRERSEAESRGADALREAAAARDAVARERDALRTQRADAEAARDRAMTAAATERARALETENAARDAEREAAELRAVVERMRQDEARKLRAGEDVWAVVQQLGPHFDTLRRAAAELAPMPPSGGADAARRGQQEWQRQR